MITPSGFELPRIVTPPLSRRLGITRAQQRTHVARGTWRRLANGVVLTRPDEPTRWDWAEAGVVSSAPTGALSGWDALRVLGLAPPPPADLPILVLTREGRSRHLGPVLIRRTDRPFASRLTGFDDPHLPLTPVTIAPRAVADAALMCRDLATVRALVARTVQRGKCRPEQIEAELAAGPRGGSRHLRTALAEVAAGARSAAEASALAQLRRSRLPEFEFNVPVLDASGRLVYEIDVLWREYRAALEIEGRAYHFDQPEWDGTLSRHNALTGGRLSMVHYSPRVIDTPGGRWLDETEHWLRGRAAELGRPYRAGSPRRPLRQHDPEPLRLDLFGVIDCRSWSLDDRNRQSITREGRVMQVRRGGAGRSASR